jgi:hypothetical protein
MGLRNVAGRPPGGLYTPQTTNRLKGRGGARVRRTVAIASQSLWCRRKPGLHGSKQAGVHGPRKLVRAQGRAAQRIPRRSAASAPVPAVGYTTHSCQPRASLLLLVVRYYLPHPTTPSNCGPPPRPLFDTPDAPPSAYKTNGNLGLGHPPSQRFLLFLPPQSPLFFVLAARLSSRPHGLRRRIRPRLRQARQGNTSPSQIYTLRACRAQASASVPSRLRM